MITQFTKLLFIILIILIPFNSLASENSDDSQEETPATGEASLELSYPIIGPISVFTSHTFDFIEYVGSYFGDAGLSYEHKFHSKLSMVIRRLHEATQ